MARNGPSAWWKSPWTTASRAWVKHSFISGSSASASGEPLPQEHAFWTCPNLILTQHTGGGTEDEIDRKIDVFTDNLARYHEGKPLVGIVDFEKGY